MNEIVRVESILKEATVKKAEINLPMDVIKGCIQDYIKDFEGLVYTDNNIKDAKTDRTTLNKIKKNLNDFGIKTEKALTQDVKNFRAELKEVISIIEEPLKQIDEKVKQYEEEQKELKLIFVKDCITKLCIEQELDVEDYEKIEVKNQYLNASESKKKIEEDILHQIQNIKDAKEKRKLEETQIIQAVELENVRNQLNVPLQVGAYVQMLDFKEFEEIKKTIVLDCKKQKQQEEEYAKKIREEEERKKQEEIKKIQQEEERKREEALRIQREEEEKRKKEEEEKHKKEIEAKEKEKEEALKVAQSVSEQVEKVIPVQPKENEQVKMYKATFKVRGSKEQLEKLLEYFKLAEIEFEKL